MKVVNLVYRTLIVAGCLLLTSATSKSPPIWELYKISELRWNELLPYYKHYDGNDGIARQIMKEAEQSDNLVNEYIMLSDFMMHNNAGYSISAVLLASNAWYFLKRDPNKYADLKTAIDNLPQLVQRLRIDEYNAIGTDQRSMCRSLTHNKVDAVPVRFVKDDVACKWRLKYNHDSYSYTLEINLNREPLKMYASDDALIRLVRSDTAPDGNEQWQLRPVQNAGDHSKFRIVNELRNECVCQKGDEAVLRKTSCDSIDCTYLVF